MFSVYGTSGRLFRGTLEQLRQVGGVGALARSRAILATERDGRDVPAELAGAFIESLGSSGARTTATEDSARNPLAAYTETQVPLAQRRPLSTVRDVMSQSIITLRDSANVMQAWQVLSEKGVGQAPVVDAAGQLVGLLTRADLLKPERLPTPDSHALVWRALMQQNVRTIMFTPVPSVAADSDLRRVARVLLDTGLPGLPVVDDAGLVIGFVSRSDILRAVVTDPPLDLWG
ncbi:MAG: CBS domain-containing protein [Rhodoferax sp.]|jgi:CBS-domain-containing membrane protein|uniref:CBS domain-containing protein n=1 Tax=Rhodoferax sp. TaxID=50421 RepID=UPI001B7C5EE8|nr:CBS domain-containing protein [Rhodoferax sp.]MBP8285585.1 CBS domain-containing protein [Rhodoferax sp.]MBP9148290.1 CBS domain-containing protein [Rhodoferax sp.]MBP9737261.1 CBS domain-containing protein [Rhodoferax sp.]